MRLLTRTTLYFLITMVPLLGIAGYYLFTQFSKQINKRMDEELLNDEIHWIRYLEKQADIGTTFILKTPELLIYPVDAPATRYPRISDTNLEDESTNKKYPYRELQHVIPVDGIHYYISIRRSQEQKTLLVASITRMMLFVFLGLFIATMLFNWLISNRLWKPFRLSLEKIRNAELHKMEAIRFESADIKEFDELNASLNALTGKIYQDYINMKEFTENAAHEMQTPLAVVQSKIELLMQDSNIRHDQVESLMQAASALKHLSKLNQSLLLLAKIENNQFEARETVNVTEVIQKYLRLFEDIIRDKRVHVETHFVTSFILVIHPLLADSLVSNLLGNAVKYNMPGGHIVIRTDEHAVEIANTSELPGINPDQLFKRFHTSGHRAAQSVGLGLAIVSKIAQTHQLQIDYAMKDGLHRFRITKNK